MWWLLAIPSVVVMVVSDLRSRTVEAWTIAVTCVVIASVSVAEFGLRGAFVNMLSNMLFCLPAGLCVMGYLKARQIRCCDAVGAGDILFILALTPMFPLKGFLVFLIVSSMLTLAAWGVYASAYKY